MSYFYVSLETVQAALDDAIQEELGTARYEPADKALDTLRIEYERAVRERDALERALAIVDPRILERPS